jgi:hypothetical protein
MMFTYALVLIFALLMMYQLGKSARRPIIWMTSKPHLAGCGLASAGVACGAALGLLLYCGAWYLDLMGVVPFLVICGFDNLIRE